jgi:hypothetical protein
MRERSSIAEILALYEGGTISGLEVLSGAWKQCHDQPALRQALVTQFLNYPEEKKKGDIVNNQREQGGCC